MKGSFIYKMTGSRFNSPARTENLGALLGAFSINLTVKNNK
jgi:hypothetical protein